MAKSTLAGVRTQEVANEASRASGAYLKCASLPEKNLIGIPWMVAFALRADGWYLRSDIIWAKRNCMPESVRDRPTRAHEYLFLLTKRPNYFYDATAIEEDGTVAAGTRAAKGSAARGAAKGVNGRPPEYFEYTGKRNKRSVWWVATQPFAEAHFATFPPELIEPCILAGTSERGCCAGCGAPWVRETAASGWAPSCACPAAEIAPCTVLDPFFGAGTTGLVADRLGRDCIGIELNPEYAAMARARVARDAPLLVEVA